MTGYTCSTAPLPMTLDVGKCVADRPERFVTLYMIPILGPRHSTKVHRLLCHVMGAIRMHGNINNGNAGINERLHKEDKPYYARTSKGILEFTRELVVQAQGARFIQRRNAYRETEEGAAVDGGSDREDGDSDEAGDECCEDDGESGDGANGRVDAADEAESGPAPPAAARGVAGTVSRRPAYHLRQVQLSTVAQWPGLADIAAALELPDDALVRLTSRFSFMAVFECGWTCEQLLYASPCFRVEEWYDFVLYRSTEDRHCLWRRCGQLSVNLRVTSLSLRTWKLSTAFPTALWYPGAARGWLGAFPRARPTCA